MGFKLVYRILCVDGGLRDEFGDGIDHDGQLRVIEGRYWEVL